ANVERQNARGFRDAAGYALRRRHDAASNTTAAPRPPAAHTVSKACLPFLFLSSRSVDRTMRAPVAANGWPMAIEPPLTLSFEGSTSPVAEGRPSHSSANFFDAIAFKFAATCAANAS